MSEKPSRDETMKLVRKKIRLTQEIDALESKIADLRKGLDQGGVEINVTVGYGPFRETKMIAISKKTAAIVVELMVQDLELLIDKNKSKLRDMGPIEF